MKQRDATRIASWRFQPGHSGNPSGRPKHDLAAEIARAAFENNADALYKAFSKALLKGNAYAYKELADRAYGKLKEVHQVEVHPFADLNEQQLLERIRVLEDQLGIKRKEPELLSAAADESDKPKPN